jgi:hypothetical protein
MGDWGRHHVGCFFWCLHNFFSFPRSRLIVDPFFFSSSSSSSSLNFSFLKHDLSSFFFLFLFLNRTK